MILKNPFSFLQEKFPLFVSKTAKHTYLVSLGNISSVLFAFLYTITLVRVLTISDFGYFSAILSFLMLVVDMADVGIGSSLSRFLPPLQKDPKKLSQFVKSAFIIQLLIGVFICIGIMIFASSIATVMLHDSQKTNLVQIITVGIFTSIAASFFQAKFSAQQEFLKASIINVLGGFFRLLLLLILFLFSAISLSNAVWTQTGSFILLMLVALRLGSLDFLKSTTDNKALRQLVSFTFHLALARSLTAIAGRLDTIMLVTLKNATEAGIYATASRVVSVYPLFAGSFSTVIAPKIAAMGDKHSLTKFMTKVIFSTFGLIATIFVFIIIAKPFMLILFTNKAAAAIPVLQLLLIGMIFFVGSIPSVSLIIYHLKKPHILAINGVIQVVIVTVGNLVFIPKYGRYGPAISLILAYSITLFLTSFLCWYYFRKKHG